MPDHDKVGRQVVLMLRGNYISAATGCLYSIRLACLEKNWQHGLNVGLNIIRGRRPRGLKEMKIIRRVFMVVSVTAVIGCASNVLDTRDTTPRTLESKLNSSLSAKCIVRNVDERYGALFTMPIQEGSRPNVLELRVRGADVGVAAIFEIEPAGKGSLVTGWISNNFGIMKDFMFNGFTEGC